MKEQLFNVLVHIANESYDGHLSILKFTTNWRISFGTPEGREEITAMPYGKTFEETAIKIIIEHEMKSVNQNETKETI